MGSTITVDFHGDRLTAITDDRGASVPLRPLIEGMGLDWSSQLKRVRRDPILAGSVVMMTTESDRAAVCLPLDLVPGFLFTIDTSRLRDEAIRLKVIEYQRGCFRVLADACLGRATARPGAAPVPQPTAAVPTELALRLVAEARQSFDRYVGREVWFATGLLVTPGMRTAQHQGSLFTYTAHPHQGGQP